MYVKKNSVYFEKTCYKKLLEMNESNSFVINRIITAFIGIWHETDVSEEISSFAKDRADASEDLSAKEYWLKLSGLFDTAAEPRNTRNSLPKVKISVDLLEHAAAVLDACCIKYGVKPGNTINSFVSIILGLPEDIKKDLCLYLEKLRQKAEEIYIGPSEAFFAAKRYKKLELLTGAIHLLDPGPLYRDKNEMNIMPLSSGKCFYPKEWFVLDGLFDTFGRPEDCRDAYVLECVSNTFPGNGEVHFIFFSNFPPKNLSGFGDAIIGAMLKKYLPFAGIKGVKERLGSFGVGHLLAEYPPELMAGCFPVPVYGDPLYFNSGDIDYEPPYGAIIVPEL